MPLTCRSVQHLYDAYLDGELSSSLLAEVEAHLLQCPECQRQVDLLRAAANVIATDAMPLGLPDGFSERILARLPTRAERTATPIFITRREARRRLVARVAAGALPAIAAMIAAAVLIWPTRNNSTSTGRVLGRTESGPIDAFGVRSLVDPTLEGVANTGRVAGQFRSFYQMAVAAERGDKVAPADEATGTAAAPVLLMDLLHPFLSIAAPAAPAAPAEEVVRF